VLQVGQHHVHGYLRVSAGELVEGPQAYLARAPGCPPPRAALYGASHRSRGPAPDADAARPCARP
jgi:hypothetical protein